MSRCCIMRGMTSTTRFCRSGHRGIRRWWNGIWRGRDELTPGDQLDAGFLVWEEPWRLKIRAQSVPEPLLGEECQMFRWLNGFPGEQVTAHRKMPGVRRRQEQDPAGHQ